MPPVQSPPGQSAGAPSPLTQLIYYSRPFGFDDLALTGILAQAERNNPRHGITGALICREDLFIQLLEGPTENVQFAFDRIRGDDRHTDVVLITQHQTPQRMFPDWAMRHDPANSWMWSREEVTAGLPEKATPDEYISIFQRLASAAPAAAQGCPMAGTAARA